MHENQMHTSRVTEKKHVPLLVQGRFDSRSAALSMRSHLPHDCREGDSIQSRRRVFPF